MDLKFKVGEIVAYIPKYNGEMYKIEIGEIKELFEDGAFVYYHTGDTAAKTNYSDLYKIDNAYAINRRSKSKEEDFIINTEKALVDNFMKLISK